MDVLSYGSWNVEGSISLMSQSYLQWMCSPTAMILPNVQGIVSQSYLQWMCSPTFKSVSTMKPSSCRSPIYNGCALLHDNRSYTYNETTVAVLSTMDVLSYPCIGESVSLSDMSRSPIYNGCALLRRKPSKISLF